MNLSETCIKRPVFATVLSLILVVIGVMGFTYLNTRFFPKFQQHSIMITTNYTGASAKLVETSITTPLENALSGIEGIDVMESISAQGQSTITLKILQGFNAYELANKVRNKIAMAQYQLPSSVKPPMVQAGWGSMDLMDIAFTDQHKSLDDLRDYLERYVINRIQQIPGIADVAISGANKYAMRIWLNPQKIAALDLSIDDITTAISNSNVELPAGEIKADSINYPITAATKLNTAKQFGNIIIKNNHGHIIYLKDVAKIQLGSDEANKTIVNVNGKPGVVLTIYNGTDANPIAAAGKVEQLSKQLQNQLPPGMRMLTTFNQATFMRASVHEVYVSIFFAILCVGLVILLFLGRLRTVLIPIATIPICLMAAFGLMYFMGFSINVITLLAIVLSIGLVVDDAIVMLENIHRHIENGLKPLAAAIKGSREITFAVVAMTLTLAAVYAPIGLVKGHGSTIFKSFALTLAGAVIISGFVALTLSPMMCAYLLGKREQPSSRYQQWLEAFFDKLSQQYQRLLGWVLKVRSVVVIIAVAIAAGGYFLFTTLPKAFMPAEDMGFVVAILHPPSGVNANYLEKHIAKINTIMQKIPAIQATLSLAGDGNRNFIFADLKPFANRHISAKAIANQVNQAIHQIPGLNASAFAPSFGSSMQQQIKFYLVGSSSYLALYKVSNAIVKALNQQSDLKLVHSDLNFDNQQYQLHVNRALAGNAAVSVKAIDNTLAKLLGGATVSTFNIEGRDYDVYLQAADNYLHSLDAINHFYVKNTAGQLVPLSSLVQIKSILSQPNLIHYDRLRAATLTAQLQYGVKLGTAVKNLQQLLPKLLPDNVKYAFAGRARQMLQSSGNMGMLFILAIVFIFLVLAAQFESFIDPLIILLAVPLSIVGALLSLKLVNGSINIYTSIGLVTLIGLIAKHGILITQFANRLQSEGMPMTTALIQAATTRLRPILMTTAAMVFGVIPLIFASGASAISREQIGVVLSGGLLFGTFFSLVLVPVAYSYAAGLKGFVRKCIGQ